MHYYYYLDRWWGHAFCMRSVTLCRDLSGYGEIQSIITQSFSSPNEEVKAAASYALGKATPPLSPLSTLLCSVCMVAVVLYLCIVGSYFGFMLCCTFVRVLCMYIFLYVHVRYVCLFVCFVACLCCFVFCMLTQVCKKNNYMYVHKVCSDSKNLGTQKISRVRHRHKIMSLIHKEVF